MSAIAVLHHIATRTTSVIKVGFRRVLTASYVLLAATAAPARAGGCSFEMQGDGRVASVIDGRSFRLTDGREIRLAGVEEAGSAPTTARRTAALSSIIAGRDVTLQGMDDAPDRYGRQNAFVLLSSSGELVQSLLLALGAALASPEVADRNCFDLLLVAEGEARRTKKGLWADPTVIKNAERPDDILAVIGRFTVVEGKVLSVRQAGTMTYLNFGRNFTRDFAVAIPRRMMPAVESAGIVLKSLENRRIRVRGWIETRPGPRIEVHHAGQIEVLGGGD
jgi:endonuclease YncB( thermonuclease family)